MKNIILIGMMGCGKTTAGHMLAQQLGRPFVDCDELMEGTTGRTISQIFAQDGERGFRSPLFLPSRAKAAFAPWRAVSSRRCSGRIRGSSPPAAGQCCPGKT